MTIALRAKAALAALALSCALAPAVAQATIKIGSILSVTGPPRSSART